MGGKRTSREELAQLEALTKEGLTAREIGQKLGRSPAAIRNLRYKKHLVTRAEDETKALFQQRDELSSMVRSLQGKKTTLTCEVDDLRKEKEKLETFITADRLLLQQTLSQALLNLKQQRPDLFMITGEEQMARLLGLLLKGILA